MYLKSVVKEMRGLTLPYLTTALEMCRISYYMYRSVYSSSETEYSPFCLALVSSKAGDQDT